jgi:glutamate dehydrogenase (NAD(P)+)
MDYEGSHVERGDAEGIIDVPCDIWIPAARPDVIRADNIDRLQASMVVSGANIAVTADAEPLLHERGVLNIPDFIANAGGVICAAMEYQGATERAAFEAIEEKVRNNTRSVLQLSRERGCRPREAAVTMARTRVSSAMSTKRWGLF